MLDFTTSTSLFSNFDSSRPQLAPITTVEFTYVARCLVLRGTNEADSRHNYTAQPASGRGISLRDYLLLVPFSIPSCQQRGFLSFKAAFEGARCNAMLY